MVEEVLRRWQAAGTLDRCGDVQHPAARPDRVDAVGQRGRRAARGARAKDDGLFVKNLENVQGDERDVIIFSTGFSVDANGVLPLNFGPLNRSGGERRLNVAVTRARRRVMVFTLLRSGGLRVEQTSSVGIKHLGGYLEQAKYGVRPGPGCGSEVGDRPARRARSPRRCAQPGCMVQTEVGLSEFRIDLAVAAPGRGEVATWPCCWTDPWAARHDGGPGRRTGQTSCRRSWAGPPWPGSGCRPGWRTPTRSWPGSSSPRGRRHPPLVGSGSES